MVLFCCNWLNSNLCDVHGNVLSTLARSKALTIARYETWTLEGVGTFTQLRTGLHEMVALTKLLIQRTASTNCSRSRLRMEGHLPVHADAGAGAGEQQLAMLSIVFLSEKKEDSD